jgi:hypothetical protein
MKIHFEISSKSQLLPTQDIPKYFVIIGNKEQYRIFYDALIPEQYYLTDLKKKFDTKLCGVMIVPLGLYLDHRYKFYE